MDFDSDSDSDLEGFIEHVTYEGVDSFHAVQIASDLSKKYDFLSSRFLLWGWGQLPADDLSVKISQKELDALYRKLRSSAQNLQDCLNSMHVLTKVNGSLRLLLDLDLDLLDSLINAETPKKEEFQDMNECKFLGGVALAYDQMYPHKEFKKNDLLIKAVLDIQRSFNFRRQHSPSESADNPTNSLNKYLQRGRKMLAASDTK